MRHGETTRKNSHIPLVPSTDRLSTACADKVRNLRQTLYFEDVGEMAFIPFTRIILWWASFGTDIVPFLCAKIDDEQRHTVACQFVETKIRVAHATMLLVDQIEIGPSDIGVGDDVVGVENTAIFETDAFCSALLDNNFGTARSGGIFHPVLR